MAAATIAAKINSTGKGRMPQKQKINSISAPRWSNKANKNGGQNYNNAINSHQFKERLPKTHEKPIPNYLKPTVISSTHAAAAASSGHPPQTNARKRRASPSSTMAAPPATATARRRLTSAVNKSPSPSSSSSSSFFSFSSSSLPPKRPSTAIVLTKARAPKRTAAAAAPRTQSMANASQGPSSANQDTRRAAAASAEKARRLLKLAMAERMRNAIVGAAPITLATILEEDEEKEFGSLSSSPERKDKGIEEAAPMAEEKVNEADLLSAADYGAVMEEAAAAEAESQRSRVKALAGAFGGVVSFLKPESRSGRQGPPVVAAV